MQLDGTTHRAAAVAEHRMSSSTHQDAPESEMTRSLQQTMSAVGDHSSRESTEAPQVASQPQPELPSCDAVASTVQVPHGAVNHAGSQGYLLFSKQLTLSDTNRAGRIVMRRHDVETFMPHIANAPGVSTFSFVDAVTGERYSWTVKRWETGSPPRSLMYVMHKTRAWRDARGAKTGDLLSVYAAGTLGDDATYVVNVVPVAPSPPPSPCILESTRRKTNSTRRARRSSPSDGDCTDNEWPGNVDSPRKRSRRETTPPPDTSCSTDATNDLWLGSPTLPSDGWTSTPKLLPQGPLGDTVPLGGMSYPLGGMCNPLTPVVLLPPIKEERFEVGCWLEHDVEHSDGAYCQPGTPDYTMDDTNCSDADGDDRWNSAGEWCGRMDVCAVLAGHSPLW